MARKMPLANRSLFVAGVGTLLQDMREDYLEAYGGEGEARDRCAAQFDEQLASMASEAFSQEVDD